MNLLQGQDATCPHSRETINLRLDLSIRVSYTAADGEVTGFSVESAG